MKSCTVSIVHPSLDFSLEAVQSLPNLRSTTPHLQLAGFPKYVLRFYGARVTILGSQGNEIIANSRGSRKRDDMLAKRANPSDAQLGERNSFTIRYC
jgi:hypothetical protein